jgi:uncharacterized protein YkwD
VNHRRSPRGYHSRVALGTIAAALLVECAPVQPLPLHAPSPPRLPGQPWRAQRQAVVAQINAARNELGLAPLNYDPLLERVGDAHCAILLEEGGDGHFSRSGVPPYLRWLLAGGHGFHVENVGSYSTTGRVTETALGGILARSVASMLAEVPPADGHRRALLDRWVTHIGVGLAWNDREVRMTHELATEVGEEWAAPPLVARPHTGVELAGHLPRPWEVGPVEVLREELPRPLTDAELRAISSYAYPPRRAMVYPNRPAAEPGAPHAPHDWAPRTGSRPPFTVDRRGNFSYTWTTGPHDGVEIVLLWASRGTEQPYVPVGASATVVMETGHLPPELAFWQRLGTGPEAAPTGEP